MTERGHTDEGLSQRHFSFCRHCVGDLLGLVVVQGGSVIDRAIVVVVVVVVAGGRYGGGRAPRGCTPTPTTTTREMGTTPTSRAPAPCDSTFA